MECLTKCLREDQTRFTCTITTKMCGRCCVLGAQPRRGREPQCAPRIALNSTHLSCPHPLTRPGPGGGRDESDTVPAHQEPAVCRRGQHTHKLLGSWVTGDQRAGTGMRGRLGRGGDGGVISLSKSGSRTEPKMALCRVIQSLQLCWPLLCLEGLLELATLPPAGLRVSAAPPPSGPAPPLSPSSALSRGCLGGM